MSESTCNIQDLHWYLNVVPAGLMIQTLIAMVLLSNLLPET